MVKIKLGKSHSFKPVENCRQGTRPAYGDAFDGAAEARLQARFQIVI